MTTFTVNLRGPPWRTSRRRPDQIEIHLSRRVLTPDRARSFVAVVRPWRAKSPGGEANGRLDHGNCGRRLCYERVLRPKESRDGEMRINASSKPSRRLINICESKGDGWRAGGGGGGVAGSKREEPPCR